MTQAIQFHGQQTPSYIDVEVKTNACQITLPLNFHNNRAKKLSIVEAFWNLSVPKEDTDPNDKLNYVISYQNSNDKTQPRFLFTRNPVEGFWGIQMKSLFVDCVGYGSFDKSGAQTDVLGRFFQDTNNTNSISIKYNDYNWPVTVTIPSNVQSIVLFPRIEWLWVNQFPTTGANFTEPEFNSVSSSLFQKIDYNTNLIELPITHSTVPIGNGVQPIWNRPLFLKIKIEYI